MSCQKEPEQALAHTIQAPSPPPPQTTLLAPPPHQPFDARTCAWTARETAAGGQRSQQLAWAQLLRKVSPKGPTCTSRKKKWRDTCHNYVLVSSCTCYPPSLEGQPFSRGRNLVSEARLPFHNIILLKYTHHMLPIACINLYTANVGRPLKKREKIWAYWPTHIGKGSDCTTIIH